MNQVTLIGNLGMDPEIRYTHGGSAVMQLRLATSESFKGRDGNTQKRTEWHTVVVWGNRAEALSKILQKGRSIAVVGRIQYRDWEDKQGNKRWSTEIVANNIVLLGGHREKRGDSYTGGYDDAQATFGDEDVPF